MTGKHLRFGKGFSVALGNRRAQAATMVITPGDSEGGEDNRHRGADQWLFVVAGTGWATTSSGARSTWATAKPTGTPPTRQREDDDVRSVRTLPKLGRQALVGIHSVAVACWHERGSGGNHGTGEKRAEWGEHPIRAL